MKTMWLRIRAPFAAFRGFQANSYRSTSPVMPPSTAYGLIFNLAGIEMRGTLESETTEIRANLPILGIAVGLITSPDLGVIYQQLHGYPVGKSGEELSKKTHGAKYWITPIRREILIGYDGIVGIRDQDGAVLERVAAGLAGTLDVPRYGLPFAGDNNLLIDRIDLLDSPPPTRWYTRIDPDDPPRRGSTRLTVGIDRRNNSRTSSWLAAPLAVPQTIPPPSAWVWTPSDPV